tara:strand:+ start:852 stop:1364 length:513 start_codon:yes stop_codon:yes gene_type:complete
LSKKRKKKNKNTLDLGSQELIRNEDNTLTRKVDGEVFRFAFYGEDRHLEKVYKSVLENYHARGMLCNYDRNVNDKRFWAGSKFEQICYHAGLQQKITAKLTEMVVGVREDFVIDNIDAHSYFHTVVKELGKFWNIAWWVMVLNKPARQYKRKGMEELQECLDRLVVLFDL